MDLPPQSSIVHHYRLLCCFFHALEKSGRGLEKVNHLHTLWRIPLTGNRKLKAIDFFGAFLALGGSAVLVVGAHHDGSDTLSRLISAKLGLTWAGGEYLWDSSHVIAALTVGIVISAAFVIWQWKGAKFPLIPSKSL